MKIADILSEADIASRIKRDPNISKQLAIAYRHDRKIPRAVRAKLGPRPDPADIADEWNLMLDQSMRDTLFGDLTRDFKYYDWLTKLYAGGHIDWEDISGIAIPTLAKYHALMVRNLLAPNERDLNRIASPGILDTVLNKYRDTLAKITDAARVEHLKRTARHITLIDDDRFSVTIPLTYGACYMFNHTGTISTFCTGTGGTDYWFKDYTRLGLMVDILDKQNMESPVGKWQMHAQSHQLRDSKQTIRGTEKDDEWFGRLFPGLMPRIVRAISTKRDEISAASKEINGKPYDIDHEINLIKQNFPQSMSSNAKDDAAADQ